MKCMRHPAATRLILLAVLTVSHSRALFSAEALHGPVRVRPERFYPLLMPDGAVWGVSVQALAEGRLAVCAVESVDGGHTWSDRRTLVELPKVEPPTTVWGDGVPLVDRDRVLHYFVLRWDQSDTKAPTAKLALWHLKAGPPYAEWTEPRLWFDGYIGALLSAIEMPDGTIVSPFAYMTDRHYSKPAAGLMGYVYMGEHTTTAVYSTDRGDTFRVSPTPINIPASIIIGNENGAIEPVCLPLKDGRAWMLMRTQRGRQWESFSEDGVSWAPARPSRFISSDSPAGLVRLLDGRIVVIWNCCQRYPYAHGGRQVLHAAISADEGQSWQGFREVLRDPRRLEPAHPIRGDYGTAYPVGCATRDGKLLFATGQGQSTGVFVLDPAWLAETQQADDFSHGLEAWSAYGTRGTEVVPHPERAGAQALRLERVDADFPAGAVWNFPNGRRGTVRIRFQLLPGGAGTSITLTDHFSSPFDVEGELSGLYTLSLAAGDAGPNGQRLAANEWHELELAWDVAKQSCEVSVDQSRWKAIPLLRLMTEGANYLRFRSLADGPSAGGLLIESVAAHVEQEEPADESALAGDWVQVASHAEFSPRDTSSGTVHQGRMWLSNGYYHGNKLIRDLWSSKDGITWECVVQETPYDGYSEIASFQDRLWAVKGSVWSSADGKQWSKVLDQTPFGVRSYGNLIVHDGQMWQIGSGSDVWSSPDGVHWTCVADNAPFGERSHMEVVVFEDRFWLMGGRSDRANNPAEKGYPQYTTFHDVWTFTPRDRTWNRVTEHAPWSPRMWSATTVHAGRIWLIGGYDNVHHRNLGDVWYSKDGATWNQLESTHAFSARHEPTLYIFADRLWLVAGNSWPVQNDVWRLELRAHP